MTSLLVQLGLHFPNPHDEEAFRTEFCVRQRPKIQLALMLGGFFYYVFFIWDRMIDPTHAEVTHAIRAVLTLVCFLCAVLLYFKQAEAWMEEVQTFAVLMASLGLSAIYAILVRGFEFGGVGIVIVILFNLALLRTRFPYVLVFSIISWISFNAVQLWDGESSPWLLVTNNLVVGSSAFIGLFSVATREIDSRAQFVLKREVQESKRQIEEMVHSMLPSQIVKRMAAGETVIADSYGEVSIVFADLVGFTKLTRTVAPGHLVEILNSLFSHFDERAFHHRVEKIKTIGDAYMAVCGMEKGDTLHAERAAEFAFDMLSGVEALSKETGLDLNIRIGLHVGPIIAGVIGTRKPAFDCWGDSVNIASRMESSALVGGIQVSETAHWRLQEKYQVVENVLVDIKGIGMTKTYSIYRRDVAVPCPADVSVPEIQERAQVNACNFIHQSPHGPVPRMPPGDGAQRPSASATTREKSARTGSSS
jgi:class 3 adenylate cyclase